jgi:hypothetical protein
MEMDIAQLRVQIEAARERARAASSANQAEVKRLMRELERFRERVDTKETRGAIDGGIQ